MILTLTPNPSIDRTVALDGELARGQVHRVASVTSQAGGKGVNISRAAVSADIPSIAVVPAAKDDPFVIELLARRHRLPARAPRRRRAGQPHHHRARRHHDQAQLPRRRRPPAPPRADGAGRAGPCLQRRLDGARRARCPRAPRPSSTPTSYAACARSAAGWPSTPARPRCRRSSTRCPASAPDLMKPNGEELASFTGGDADELESDPAATAAAARQLIERGVGAVLATLGGNGAVLVTAGRRLARHPAPHHRRQHRRCRRLQPLRLPARRHPGAARPGPPGTGRRLRQRRRRSPRHHHPPAVAAPHGARRRHRPPPSGGTA